MGSRFLGGCRALMEASKASASGRKSRGSGLTKPVPVSPQLGKFLGGVPEASRSLAVKKVWEYIKLHNLQNPADKREICCDEKLKSIFDGKEKVGFLEVAKLLPPHFPKVRRH